MNQHINSIVKLYESKFNAKPNRVEVLPASGSPRIYYRIFIVGSNSLIGAFNNDVDENRAFFYLSRHFFEKGLNVPDVIAISSCEKYYLQTDLGSESLFNLITKGNVDSNLDFLLESAVKQLAKIQVIGFDGLDSTKCFPIPSFDRRSVMWDLNYFKYNFLKPSGLTFSEVKLEDEFNRLADILLDEDLNYFHYRDFQSRNIMVKDNQLYFIDYQGGRLGPCLYDLASFLYQAKAGFSSEQRNRLFNIYLNELTQYRKVDVEHLKDVFPFMVMFRILQTLGAYGFRGFFEKKTHFIQSIPNAIGNYLELANSTRVGEFNYITSLLKEYSILIAKDEAEESKGLTVSITSFSFKKGYPEIHPDHGGGFIFDCRFLPNPGRIDKYKPLNGLDNEVADYLNVFDEVSVFNNRAFDMVSSAIDNYIARDFKYLSVAFGCTGGQHRSVYCTNLLAKKLSERYNVNIVVKHREINR
ncbi:phosphotransferase [Tenuifilaceae bacterium CYCD]|nr:phosphotransferase [Tenuifilaceae bacterium CYCD]